MKKLGILLSGRGSNFEAIADNVAAEKIPAEIAVVISNRSKAKGLETARARGLKAVCIPSNGLERELYDKMVIDKLLKIEVDFVCLAGQTSTQPCGSCGTQTRTCSASCTWGSWGSCTGTGECSPGDVQHQDCGWCGTRSRACDGSCRWGSWGACGGEGACSPGDSESETHVHTA